MKLGSAPSAVQQGSEHGAGGGFAVGAGHAEAAVASQQRSQELLALTTGMPAACAAATSGLVAGTAEEINTRSAPVTWAASCPTNTVAPSSVTSVVAGEVRDQSRTR